MKGREDPVAAEDRLKHSMVPAATALGQEAPGLCAPGGEARIDLRFGARVSHWIPRWAGCSQLRWTPPSLDPRQLEQFVPVGGWTDLLLAPRMRFPGLHWNQPFCRCAGAGAGDPARSLASECVAGRVRVRRTVTLRDSGALSLEAEYHNARDEAIEGAHLRSQPMLTPGGRRTPETAVFLPGTMAVEVLTQADAVRGAGRFANLARDAVSNWCACGDSERCVTLLLEDPCGWVLEHSLHQDADLLILEQVGAVADLPPGGMRRLELVLHAYALDLRPWAPRLGASRFLSSGDLLLGLALPAAERSVREARLEVRCLCLALGEAPPAETGCLALMREDGTVLQTWALRLTLCDGGRATGAGGSFETGPLAPGSYRLVFGLAAQPAGAVTPSQSAIFRFQVVGQTRAERATLERRKLEAILHEAEHRLAEEDPDSFVGALMRCDLDAARCFLQHGRHALARDALCAVLDAPRHTGDPDLRAALDESAPAVPASWLEDLHATFAALPDLSRHPDHYGTFHAQRLTDGWHFRDDAEAAFGLAWLAAHPASRLPDRREALCRAVLAVDELCRNFPQGTLPPQIATDANINRFTLCPLGEALRLLLRLPLAPSRKEGWRAAFRRGADFQVRAYCGKPVPEGGYLNQDVMVLLLLRLAAELLDDPGYQAHCDALLTMIASQLLPDGAFCYLHPHNEVMGYHEINITYLFRDWLLSGDVRSRRLIAETVAYYPLMVDADGRVEFATETWWKHTGCRWPRLGPAVVAAITGDARNQWIAARARRRPAPLPAWERTLYAALAARGDLPEEAPPLRHVALDRNVRGPRGRFGAWSWAGTAAPYRDTLASCRFFETAPDRSLAMHFAGPQVLFGDVDDVNPYHGGMGLGMTPQAYASDAILQGEQALLAACYGLYPFEHAVDPARPSDWRCEQLWYFDAERLVGLLRLTAERDTEARAVDLSVRFADYDAVRGEVVTHCLLGEDGTYAAGPLRLRILSHTLARELVEPTWVCAYLRDRPGRGVYLRSESADGRFRAGEQFELLAEIRPRDSVPAALVRLEDGFGFRLFTEQGSTTARLCDAGGGVRCELRCGAGRLVRRPRGPGPAFAGAASGVTSA